MITESLNRLQYLCDTIPALLSNIPEDDFTHIPAPSKWSKKEILGHLIDSATNNHQRFVRAQFEGVPKIVYFQDNWVESSRYILMESQHLILFWTIYNRHLIELVKRIPPFKLLSKCKTNKGENHTIEWLFDDYVKHLEYHLRQIVSYE